jgi:parallel beta-helix repeat protein
MDISSPGTLIARNILKDCEGSGIVIHSSSNTIERNTVTDCGDIGLHVQGSLNHIEGNHLTRNMYGIRFDMITSDNVYRGNTVRGNVFFDFQDTGVNNTSHGDNYMPNQM